MKESWSETWSEEIKRRYGVLDIAEKVREARLRWYEHLIRRDERQTVRDVMQCKKFETLWGGRHYWKNEGGKAEVVWTRIKKR
jgi:hypothetical protein